MDKTDKKDNLNVTENIKTITNLVIEEDNQITASLQESNHTPLVLDESVFEGEDLQVFGVRATGQLQENGTFKVDQILSFDLIDSEQIDSVRETNNTDDS